MITANSIQKGFWSSVPLLVLGAGHKFSIEKGIEESQVFYHAFQPFSRSLTVSYQGYSAMAGMARSVADRATILTQTIVARARAMKYSRINTKVTRWLWADRKLHQVIVAGCHLMYRNVSIAFTKRTSTQSGLATERNQCNITWRLPMNFHYDVCTYLLLECSSIAPSSPITK